MKKTLFLATAMLFVLTSCSGTKVPENTTTPETTSNLNSEMEGKKTMMEDKTSMEDKEPMMEDKTLMEAKKMEGGMYHEYDMKKLSDTQTNVLFFAATWCPSCQSADKNLSSETIPENLNILKVDYDTYSDLKEKYGVTMQHTFVQVDKDGNLIKKWSGSNNSNDILSQIK